MGLGNLITVRHGDVCGKQFGSGGFEGVGKHSGGKSSFFLMNFFFLSSSSSSSSCYFFLFLTISKSRCGVSGFARALVSIRVS